MDGRDTKIGGRIVCKDGLGIRGRRKRRGVSEWEGACNDEWEKQAGEMIGDASS